MDAVSASTTLFSTCGSASSQQTTATGIGKSFYWNDIELHQAGDAFLDSRCIAEFSEVQEFFEQSLTKETGSTGNQNFHVISFIHTSPSSVLPRGRYSQPTQPL